ncbi:unnamed protein product [Thlaspi arvense]|uniref:FLZ-type domain-containing protein n=1 Tax=Thlaspi arvense TaxID=13288 RepID=A0AAU9SBU0_THLAR|nr:unnamed protein product [Thlaspi arvense]
MTDLMVSSKRPRIPSFNDKHLEFSENDAAGTDWFPDQNFLEMCRFCRKNLRHDEDLFMYGHFGAFCSKGCRAKQIACDIFMESSRQIAIKAKKGRTCAGNNGIKPKESKDKALGGNQDKIQSPQFYI